jgi:hypothetical protein
MIPAEIRKIAGPLLRIFVMKKFFSLKEKSSDCIWAA